MSISTPVYAALGRIRTCALIDTQQYDVTGAKSQTAKYEAIEEQWTRNRGLIKLLGENRVQLIIFFDDRDNQLRLSGAVSDYSLMIDGITFVSALDTEKLLHEYLQDYLVFVPDNNGSYFTHSFTVKTGGQPAAIDTGIAKYLCSNDLIPPIKEIEPAYASRVVAGGNILRGRVNKKDYLLIGNETHCQFSKAEIADLLNVEPGFVFFCPVGDEDSYFRADFYHLDLYVTIAGPRDVVVDGKPVNKEVILFGEVYGDRAEEYNIQLNNTADQLRTDSGNALFYLDIRLPILSVNQTLYSYANCFTENYTLLNGKQVLRFYFPDFTADFIAEHNLIVQSADRFRLEQFVIKTGKLLAEFSPQAETTDALTELEPIARQMNMRTLIDSSYKNLKELAEKTQEALVTMLEDKLNVPADDIYFIPNDFISLAQVKAGLHCRTIVLERDRVNTD